LTVLLFGPQCKLYLIFHFLIKKKKNLDQIGPASELLYFFSYLLHLLFTWFYKANTTTVHDKHMIYKMKNKELRQLEMKQVR